MEGRQGRQREVDWRNNREKRILRDGHEKRDGEREEDNDIDD